MSRDFPSTLLVGLCSIAPPGRRRRRAPWPSPYAQERRVVLLSSGSFDLSAGQFREDDKSLEILGEAACNRAEATLTGEPAHSLRSSLLVVAAGHENSCSELAGSPGLDAGFLTRAETSEPPSDAHAALARIWDRSAADPAVRDDAPSDVIHVRGDWDPDWDGSPMSQSTVPGILGDQAFPNATSDAKPVETWTEPLTGAAIALASFAPFAEGLILVETAGAPQDRATPVALATTQGNTEPDENDLPYEFGDVVIRGLSGD
ncbi:MAG: hypothetical protein P4L84_32255 [Isosphaeraceae bacterium]|nr:hypothetical protein [Isosphaeraceae bacterium]